MLQAAENFHRVAPPDDRDYHNVGLPSNNKNYYNVNVTDQGNYGQLSAVANDNHTYSQLNTTKP